MATPSLREIVRENPEAFLNKRFPEQLRAAFRLIGRDWNNSEIGRRQQDLLDEVRRASGDSRRRRNVASDVHGLTDDFGALLHIHRESDECDTNVGEWELVELYGTRQRLRHVNDARRLAVLWDPRW